LLILMRTRWETLVPAHARLVLWLVLFVGMGASLTGCNGGGFSFGSTNVITVTATSGTVQHTTTITLNVQ
jgi:hypothetical protein